MNKAVDSPLTIIWRLLLSQDRVMSVAFVFTVLTPVCVLCMIG
jgi:hypothetical protein